MNYIMNQIPILVVLIPLLTTLFCPVVSKISVSAGRKLVISGLFGALICSIVQLINFIKTGEIVHYWIGGWQPPYGIEFVIDGVNGLIIVLVATISFLTALFSSPFERPDKKQWFRSAGYYTMLSFLAVGLLGMSSTGDAFNYYVFMEITALAGYGLIAVGEEKGPIAAFRYLLIGTVGASFYLVGLGFLYVSTGTLNMADLAEKLSLIHDNPLVIISVACMIIGLGIKMALFPLHGWQPGAHSYAHPAADPMIAAIMIKVPAYAMLRFFYCVFRETTPAMEFFFQVIGVLGMLGVLYGSLKALRYDTYNKILAFSSIGQVGYIAIGFAIGNTYGLIGAVLHIVSHAFMKAGLFYTSGALKYRYEIHETKDIGQIYREMPLTGATMVICALSMIGLPPFAGFFSKWYLALGAIQNGQYYYVAVLIISSLLSAIYFFRIIEKLFMNKKNEQLEINHTLEKKKLELPWQMMIPLASAALMIVIIGLFNSYIVSDVLKTTIMEVFLI